MKMAKKCIAIISTLFIIAGLLVGCTKPTETQILDVTETPVSTPTATPTLIPTPTPKPNPADLYTWEYAFNEWDPETINVCIVVKEGADWRDITEVEVPAYIDGYKVTCIPDDLLGSRSEWGGRRGLCQVYDPINEPDVWTDPQCAVEKIIFPETIEVFQGNTFWFGCGSLEEIVFKGTDNIKSIGRYALHQTLGEVYLAEDNDGFLVINGKLVCALADEEVVFPADVKETVNCFFGGYWEDYSIVKVVRINDGCEKIDRYFTEAYGCSYLTSLTDIYVPASVTSIDNDMVWWNNINGFNFHVVKDSYADQWLKERSWPADKIIYDME